MTKIAARRAVVRIRPRALRGKGAKPVCIKRVAENRHITRILVYSAIKISANFPALYSVLNPETSSDSPSAKSKGARFVSATQVNNQVRATGERIRSKGKAV